MLFQCCSEADLPPIVKGVYHQSKELERVLAVTHNVVLSNFPQLPDPHPAHDNALYIIMPAFSASTLPPHYILYQTEQWGHPTLQPHSATWANKQGNSTRQITLDAFEVSALLPVCVTVHKQGCECI